MAHFYLTTLFPAPSAVPGTQPGCLPRFDYIYFFIDYIHSYLIFNPVRYRLLPSFYRRRNQGSEKLNLKWPHRRGSIMTVMWSYICPNPKSLIISLKPTVSKWQSAWHYFLSLGTTYSLSISFSSYFCCLTSGLSNEEEARFPRSNYSRWHNQAVCSRGFIF